MPLTLVLRVDLENQMTASSFETLENWPSSLMFIYYLKGLPLHCCNFFSVQSDENIEEDLPPFRDDTQSGSDDVEAGESEPDYISDEEAPGPGSGADAESNSDGEQEDPDNSDIIMIEDYPSSDPGEY